jgi:hypothetical protein
MKCNHNWTEVSRKVIAADGFLDMCIDIMTLNLEDRKYLKIKYQCKNCKEFKTVETKL